MDDRWHSPTKRVETALSPYGQFFAAASAPRGTAPMVVDPMSLAALLTCLLTMVTIFQNERHHRDKKAPTDIPDVARLRDRLLSGKITPEEARRTLALWNPDDLSTFQRQVLHSSQFHDDLRSLLRTLGLPEYVAEAALPAVVEALDAD